MEVRNPNEVVGIMPTADHDLLIEVSTNVKNLTTTLHQYNAANLAVTQEHEGRLRAIEDRLKEQQGEIAGSRRTTNNFMIIANLLAALALAVSAYIGFVK